ncbi:hypothetical protein E2C01_021377 [Portunus trituberculatus]|uniref:Uncharacterized protein n=1 Tax=Portunus trituberculatus TaxID=210409 RepID=A0A5B7E2C8_PORTR|nr:hypothetical protein [Portunus trituberculatus]
MKAFGGSCRGGICGGLEGVMEGRNDWWGSWMASEGCTEGRSLEGELCQGVAGALGLYSLQSSSAFTAPLLFYRSFSVPGAVTPGTYPPSQTCVQVLMALRCAESGEGGRRRKSTRGASGGRGRVPSPTARRV